MYILEYQVVSSGVCLCARAHARAHMRERERGKETERQRDRGKGREREAQPAFVRAPSLPSSLSHLGHTPMTLVLKRIRKTTARSQT